MSKAASKVLGESVEERVLEAVDDEEDPQEDVTISLYYGEDANKNPADSIAPLPEFGLSQDRGVWEPRIKVRGCSERKASFHICPRYAEMEHVDTREPISSPFDHDDQPDRGYNVHMEGPNLEPDRYLHVLRESCKALAEEAGETWGEDRFPRPLESSNVIAHERYLRLSRTLAEKLTR